MNKFSGITYKLLGMDPDQVGIAVTTDTVLEQAARQASDRAEGRAGRPEPDTGVQVEQHEAFIRLTDTACTPMSVNLLAWASHPRKLIYRDSTASSVFTRYVTDPVCLIYARLVFLLLLFFLLSF